MKTGDGIIVWLEFFVIHVGEVVNVGTMRLNGRQINFNCTMNECNISISTRNHCIKRPTKHFETKKKEEEQKINKMKKTSIYTIDSKYIINVF